MNQLKAGDLALTLVDTLTWPAMTVVTLHTLHEPGSRIEQIHGVGVTRFHLWECISDRDEEYAYLYRPEHLMPLRGDFLPEQQKSREVVHE
ncbi:hypothetical protein ACM7QV_31460 [Pseudomonas aeruginosa]